jgi:heat shock protein HslJ
MIKHLLEKGSLGGMFNFKLDKKSFSVFFALLMTISISACTADTAEEESKPMNENTSLTGTSWWVEDIAGKGVIDMSHTTIEFGGDDNVSGDTGCNRYFGSVEIQASELAFGPLAGTRKACAAALMDQEQKFFEAMANVTGWELAETGLLHLLDQTGTSLLRASRIEE